MPFQGSGADQITGKVGAKASTPSRIAIPDARKRALVTVASHVSVRCVAILSGPTKTTHNKRPLEDFPWIIPESGLQYSSCIVGVFLEINIAAAVEFN